MNTNTQTKRRWLVSILDSVSDQITLPARTVQTRSAGKAFALRLKRVTGQGARATV